MRIILAPDSFKGSLTAKEACRAMRRGIEKVLPTAEIVEMPMADGGEGTVQSLVDATGGRIMEKEVLNPLGRKVSAQYGILGAGETAVIEMAAASGLYLISKSERNPLVTSTFGTGELIADALEKGCRNFILGIGGSATNDGGAGMAQALGARFIDAQGRELSPGGGALRKLEKIDLSDLDPRIAESRFTAACDVRNPLCGPRGASFVFGMQKGATTAMLIELDDALKHYAEKIKEFMGLDVCDIPGAGAAGGLGAGMLAFMGAELKPGVEIVIDIVGLKKKLIGATIVLTGEGQCDAQSSEGKVPYGVGISAKEYGIPCVVIAGTIGHGAERLYEYGVTSIFSFIDRPLILETAMEEANILLEKAAERIMRVIK